MKQQKRQQHPSAFKAKVASEALKERLCIAQFASAYRVHPTQVGIWKRQLLNAAPVAFAQPLDQSAVAQESLVAELFAKIGRREMELEWLQKNSSLPPETLRAMIETAHPELSIARQCTLLGLSRSSYYYQPAAVSAEELAVRAALDRAYPVSVLRESEAGVGVATGGFCGRSQAGANADAGIGLGSDLPETAPEPARRERDEIPVFTAWNED